MNPYLIALLRLVTRFVSRQSLPREVLVEKRPDLLVLATALSQTERLVPVSGQSGQGAAIPSSADSTTSTSQPRASSVSGSSHGRWGPNGEWSFFIHGLGCVIRNRVTGEPIEWDGPNLSRFDQYWFHNWLEWAIAHDPDREDTSIVAAHLRGNHGERERLVFGLLDELARAGALNTHPGTTNMYELVAPVAPRG
jgi:hypothetical protein